MRPRHFLSALVLVSVLTACGSQAQDSHTTVVTKQPIPATPAPVEHALTLDAVNSVPGYLDFTLVKVQTASTIEPSLGGGLYYENSSAGETYVDVVLDVSNTTSASVSSEEVLTACALGTSGAEYPCELYAVETSGGTGLSQYEELSPLTATRLHCGISVPESESALTICLEAEGQRYTYAYTLGQTEANSIPLSVGQSLDVPDFASITFQGAYCTDDLLPPNTSGFYTHYAVEDPNSTYLVTAFDVTNQQGTAKDSDTFLGVRAVYREKYTYTGFVVVQDADGGGFSGSEDLLPLNPRRLYVLIEVPKSVSAEPAELFISFSGEEYCFTYTPA